MIIKKRSFVNKIKDVYVNMLNSPMLHDIGKIQGTDKADDNHSFNSMSYLDIYEKYFLEFRDNDINFLEIGVRNGESLRTWKSYFKRGNIFGLDIDPKCKTLEESRVEIEIGSQDDVVFLSNCFGENKKFDIIIDDGSHVNRHIITSFDYLFNNRLNSGGVYIIEDLSCSYLKLETDFSVSENWPGMKYNKNVNQLDNDRAELNNFFLEKIKDLDHLKGKIMCIHFWAMTCVIVKV